jgi:hypothetical protein
MRYRFVKEWRPANNETVWSTEALDAASGRWSFVRGSAAVDEARGRSAYRAIVANGTPDPVRTIIEESGS